MAPLTFGTLRLSKRQWRKPWSSDPFGQDDPAFHEKQTILDDCEHEYSDDETTKSGYSSRATSDSQQPMLGGSTPPKRSVSAYDPRKHRRKFNKYFTLALASALIVFILILTRLGYVSAQSANRTRPPKPFPYESFPFLKRYHGGIRSLVSRVDNKPEYPGDADDLFQSILDSTSERGTKLRMRQIEEKQKKHDLPKMKIFDPLVSAEPHIHDCFLDEESNIKLPKLHGFEGVVNGFPDPVLGSYDLLKLDNSLCFDRFGRLGAYGFGYSRSWGGTGAGMEGDRENNDQVWIEEPEVDFRKVRWFDVQNRCAKLNRHRFKDLFDSDESLSGSTESRRIQDIEENKAPQLEKLRRDVESGSTNTDLLSQYETSRKQASRALLPRTMVVIRTWHDYQYDPEDIMYLRALISELSLASGTEYVVRFLIHVHNNDLPIWSDDEVYQSVLNASLPEEFKGLGTLWSDKQMELVYPGMDESPFRDIHLHGNYRSSFMPMQYFARMNPGYEFFWNWEMDSRYTGHFYHLFDRVSKWAKEQPRKGLWERNGRFYIPSEHGSWEDFRQMVRVQTEHGTNSKANIWTSQSRGPTADPSASRHTVEKPIWGPEPPALDDVDNSNDPHPPTSHAKDNYEWGVGEDADLITFNPLFDPENTGWNLEKDVTGYNLSSGYPPRRAAIITAARLSSRLLTTMHEETAKKKHTMFSEMWPASCALHHGLKAVYVPHPQFIDRRWPTDYLAAVYNGGRNGATGGSRTTAFNDDHQGNFLGISWFYNAGFPGNLWKRWLGYKVDNDGGEKWEVAHEGRMCLPAMLLHPVKHVNLVYEHREEEKDKGDVESHAEKKSANVAA